MSSDNLQGSILGFGNPLLDISGNVDTSWFEKYDVKPANAILAEDKHLPVYTELAALPDVGYTAGGATQNSIRVAQWMLNKAPGSTSFIGCVGDDKFGKQLATCAEAAGVKVLYRIDEKIPTGTCACLIHEKDRSLIANLAAANEYKIEHLQTAEPTAALKAARIVYIAGFFLTVSPDTIQAVAKHTLENKQIFSMNLSAPFITQVPIFADRLAAALPFVDFLFGNESEAIAWGQSNKLEDPTPLNAAKALAALPYKKEGSRTVVITQGKDDIIIASEGGEKVETFSVALLDKSLIVDANGAGDSFVGGFLSRLVQGKSIAQSVAAGSWAASYILQKSGVELEGVPDFTDSA